MESVVSDHALDEVESEGKLMHSRALVGLAVHFQLSQHFALVPRQAQRFVAPVD